MARLVIHIGPGKCGSSTIQQFFSEQGDLCKERVKFVLLSPKMIYELDSHHPNIIELRQMEHHFDQQMGNCDVLILSHEMLFKHPKAINNLCCVSMAKNTSVRIIGYARTQSSFLISAYSQWFFSSPSRILEVNNVLRGIDVRVDLFSGLERQLMASIIDDFKSARQLSNHSILDWYSNYKSISQLVDKKAEVLCGVLPQKKSGIPLVHDFCIKANLNLKPEALLHAGLVVNTRLHPDLVEAMNIIFSKGIDLKMSANMNLLKDLSKQVEHEWQEDGLFLNDLKSFIDSHFLESNKSLCSRYGISLEYFRPSANITKDRILKKIMKENRYRSSQSAIVVERYRRSIASIALLADQIFNLRLG